MRNILAYNAKMVAASQRFLISCNSADGCSQNRKKTKNNEINTAEMGKKKETKAEVELR